MLSTTTVSALAATFFTDVGSILSTVLVTLLAGLAALLGLGFAIRHVKKWITGRKA